MKWPWLLKGLAYILSLGAGLYLNGTAYDVVLTDK